nr:FMN-binding protein [Desulfobacterales bacterium]
MRDIVRMVVVLSLICGVSGGLLAGVRIGTKERIEYQELAYVKGPAIRDVLQGCSNNPIQDRFKIKHGDTEISFFPGKFDGKLNVVAFETTGKGFGGEIGIMMAVSLVDDKVVAIDITTHKETPGVGSRAKDDPAFKGSFKGLSVDDPFKIKSEGGKIDAVSGATISSKGIAAGVAEGAKLYKELKPYILKKIKART